MIDPDGGRFTYSYDDDGRMDHLVNPADERTTWTYDDANQVTTLQLANDTKATSTYDDDGRLTRLANVKSDDSVISTFDYDLDAVGNRQAVVEADGTRVTWTYDKTYQLTRERRSGASSYDVTYTYDNAGNRTLKEDSGALTTSTYDDANQLLTSQDSSGVTTYTYDEAGNQTKVQTPSGNPTQNFWDGQSRLTHIILPDTTFKAFDYNGDNLRVAKRTITTTGWKDFILPEWDTFSLSDWDTFPLDSTNSAVTKMIWDGQNLLAETNASDTTQALYTLAPRGMGDLISQRRGATSSFFHFDGLGSTDRMTSSAEAITDSYIYQAFGNIVASSGATTNPFRFVGRNGYYYDVDLSRYYIRARHYDPLVARWLSQDPLGFQGDSNLYRYAINSPVVFIDPSGEIIFTIVITAVIIGAVIGGVVGYRQSDGDIGVTVAGALIGGTIGLFAGLGASAIVGSAAVPAIFSVVGGGTAGGAITMSLAAGAADVLVVGSAYCLTAYAAGAVSSVCALWKCCHYVCDFGTSIVPQQMAFTTSAQIGCESRFLNTRMLGQSVWCELAFWHPCPCVVDNSMGVPFN